MFTFWRVFGWKVSKDKKMRSIYATTAWALSSPLPSSSVPSFPRLNSGKHNYVSHTMADLLGKRHDATLRCNKSCSKRKNSM